MNIHEYQAKDILKKHGVRVQEGYVAATPDEAVEAAQRLKAETGTSLFVVKAQIHAGGRGKAGGVKLARNLSEVREVAGKILGMTITNKQTGPKGRLVRKVLIAQDVYYPGPSKVKEFYFGILLDRNSSKNMLVASTEGGTEIEQVAKENQDLILKELIDPAVGLRDFQARKLAFKLGLSGNALKEMIKFIKALYKAYIESDAVQFEINPVIKTSDDKILAVDAKVNLDENALFRQQNLASMRDIYEEDPLEVEAGELNLNYVKLDGNVGCMVNGAGLAMATMDIIKHSGGDPANFLDVGGGANAEKVEAAFRIIMKDPNVKAILINVFGGILRCDRVAKGVVEAYHNIGNISIPIIVRLQGTNAEEGAKIIEESGLKVSSAILLKDAVERIKEVL